MNAPKPPFGAFQPGQLVSLLDMLEFGSARFIRLIVSHSVIWGLIRQFHDVPNNEKVPDEIDLDALRTQLIKLKELTEDLECKGSIPPIKRFIQAIDSSIGMTYGEFKTHLEHSLFRMADELEGRIFLSISLRDVELYQQPEPTFGREVEDKFPSSVEDISEAAKCLALDRNTACVFHLMRAMERALKVLGLKLGLQNVDIEWGPLLGAIDDKIKAMPTGAHKDKWSGCRANLYHVKQAWRNPTMHPKETYTNTQARDVLNAVRAFMQQLATLA